MEKINQSDTDVTQIEELQPNESNYIAKSQDQQRVVRAPRKMIWELALMVFTLSLYLPFWAVGRARDIKSATGNNYKPWLWFFTPLFWIAGAFAFNSLFKELHALEAKAQRDKWAFWSTPWFVAFVLLSIFFNFQTKIQVPILLYIVSLIAFCLLFALLHRRFNQWKIQDAGLIFKGKAKGYTWYEWLMLVVGVPILLLVIYEYSWKAIRTFNVPSYSNQQEVLVKNLEFGFTVHGDQWTTVEPDEADFEMIGPGDEASIFVYSYVDDQSIDDITALRFEIVEDSYDNVKCVETKKFERGRQGVRSMMSCRGRYWGNSLKLTSVVSELDGALIEFVGLTSNTSKAFTKKISKQIHSMAESFYLVSEDGDEQR